jgi:hypothetical protein
MQGSMLSAKNGISLGRHCQDKAKNLRPLIPQCQTRVIFVPIFPLSGFFPYYELLSEFLKCQYEITISRFVPIVFLLVHSCVIFTGVEEKKLLELREL